MVPGLYGDVLRARALWLVGVCGGELQQGTWAEALSLCVKHIQAPDFVVSCWPRCPSFAVSVPCVPLMTNRHLLPSNHPSALNSPLPLDHACTRNLACTTC